MYKVDGDYGTLAARPLGSVVPDKVRNLPSGAAVTDLAAGEAFGMAVLSNGDA